MISFQQLCLAVRMIPGRWMCVFGGILLQFFFDFNTSYALLSPSLRTNKKFGVGKLSFLDFAKDCTAGCGILVAYFFWYIVEVRKELPHGKIARFGLKALIVIAALLFFAGYVFIWVDLPIVHHSKKNSDQTLYYLFVMLITVATTIINGTNTMLSIMNFPTHAGLVVALMKAYYELSTEMFAELNKVYFDGHIRLLVLVMGVAPIITAVVSTFLVRFRISQNDEPNVDSFYCILYFCSGLVTVFLVMGLSMGNNEFKHRHSWVAIVTDAVVLLGVAFPLIVHYVRLARTIAAADTTVATATTASTDADAAAAANAADEAAGHMADGTPTPAFRVIVRSRNFLLFLVSAVFTMSTAKSLFHKLHIISATWYDKEVQIENIISMWGASSFTGSLIMGALSDIFLFRFGVGRPLFLALSSMVMVIGHVMLMIHNMTPGVIMVAMGFGGYLGVHAMVASEIFSLKRSSYLLPIVEATVAVVTLLLSESVVIKHHYNPKCVDIRCFQLSYVLYVIFSSLGFVVTLFVGFFTQAIYTQMMAQQNAS